MNSVHNRNNEPIRIFVDAHVFDERYQGTRTYIKELYSLLALQPDLEIYFGAHDTENLKKNFPQKSNVHFVKLNTSSSWARLLYEIPRVIRRNKIDYAHFQYIVPFFKYSRQIVTIHDVIFNEYPQEFSWKYRMSRNLFFRIAALRSELVTTVSAYSRESIGRYLKLPSNRIGIVPNGVHQRFFAPYNKAESVSYLQNKFHLGPFILYVSRIEPRKNHLTLLKAWLELKLHERGTYLVLLGYESIPVPAFTQLLQSLPEKVRSFIFIHGEIDNDDLLHFYRACQLFVYPSKAEGFGIPPLEAAALKVPVICSNSTGMAEYGFFEENHIDPDNIEILKKRMIKILDEIANKKAYENIANIIAERYSWSTAAERMYKLLMDDYNKKR